jgi:transcriptional regulator with XRE-family HTH domain
MTELAPIVVQVGTRLREARLHARLTVREAAERIGLRGHGTLVQYESGKVTPPLDRLAALADVYGVPLATLFVVHDALIPVVTLLERATPSQVALLAQVMQRALEHGSDG